MFGTLQALNQFRAHFGVGIVGSKLGLISCMYTIGGVAALPLVDQLAIPGVGGLVCPLAVAPMYCLEISYPKYCGILTGLYSCTYYAGSITASGVTRDFWSIAPTKLGRFLSGAN
ncbi:hypothetical protein V1520DRAFT_344242 [Lipomyces starkeyi]